MSAHIRLTKLDLLIVISVAKTSLDLRPLLKTQELFGDNFLNYN